MASSSTRTRRKPVVEPEDTAPSVLSLKSNPDRKVEYRDAFEIDGKSWRIRTTAPTNIRLRFSHVARIEGNGAAQDYLLEALLEPDAHEALLAFEGLTQEHIDAVVAIAVAVLIGVSADA